MWGIVYYIVSFCISLIVYIKAIKGNQTEIALEIIAVNRTNYNIQASRDNNNTSLILGRFYGERAYQTVINHSHVRQRCRQAI